MDRTLEHLIEAASAQLEALEPSETQDFCGFRQRAAEMTDLLIESLFPRHAAAPVCREDTLRRASELLETCLRVVLPPSARPESVVRTMLESLPEIRRQLGTDLEAAYRGDPAARSIDEIILCYPAFLAISTYRLAHVLYRERIPTLPRVMTEYAHRLTGIDIHPGASARTSSSISTSRWAPKALTSERTERSSRGSSAIPISATGWSSTPAPPFSAAARTSATTASSAAAFG